MVIEYVAYNEVGERVTGTVEVDTLQRAQELLWASNLIIVKLKKRRKLPSLPQLMPTFFGVKSHDVIVFTNELASLLEAGIALSPALRVLYEQTTKQALKDAIRSVIQDIETGYSFSQACTRQPTVFPPFYTRLLQVAEETGELKRILLEIAGYMERQRLVVIRIRKALTYPMIVLGVGTMAAIVLVTFALPAMTELLTEYGAKLPLATRGLLTISNLGRAYGKHLLIALAVLALVGKWYFSTPRGERIWHRILIQIPVLGNINRLSHMTRLCSSLTTLLTGGLSTAEAIRLSIDAMDNTIFREGLSEVYREVLKGSRLEPAIQKQSVFSRLFSQTIGVGEETGALKVNLRGLTTYYEQETDRAIARATELIEPSIILLAGLAIGYVGVAIISAIYGLIPQIK